MLYVESPAFVGFSYSQTNSDNTVGDQRTADDLVAFISGFYTRYPQYASRDLFLSGESYGGHYVPNLALAIVKHNAAVKAGVKAGASIPLRGLATGNAWTVAEIDNLGAAFDWWSHALVSDDCMSGIAQTCNLTQVGPLAESADLLVSSSSPTGASTGGEFEAVVAMAKLLRPDAASQGSCNYWQNRCSQEMGDINIYEIYADICVGSSGKSAGEGADMAVGVPRRHATLHHHEAAMLKALGRAGASAVGSKDPSTRRQSSIRGIIPSGSSNVPSGSTAGYDPCSDDETATYLNRADVQTALHVDTGKTISREWSDCSPTLDYSRDDLLASMLPVYKTLLQQDGEDALHIIVFSGDVDAIVPVTGTRMWLDRLGVPVSNDSSNAWRSWTTSVGQVGGYVTEYENPTATNFTFVSVRNAGHMVPAAQPSRALEMFQAFIQRSVPQQ
jgi:serine carboxypeptidase-like clade 2